MKIYANLRQEVQINPKDVIKKLIEKEIGCFAWIFEEQGKFYLGSKEDAGCHSFDLKNEITEEKYRYVKALQLVLEKLNLHPEYKKEC